ncbi:MAG: hypothetical protein WD065_22505, partial [Planctomycetaceae bacterium]
VHECHDDVGVQTAREGPSIVDARYIASHFALRQLSRRFFGDVQPRRSLKAPGAAGMSTSPVFDALPVFYHFIGGREPICVPMPKHNFAADRQSPGDGLTTGIRRPPLIDQVADSDCHQSVMVAVEVRVKAFPFIKVGHQFVHSLDVSFQIA